jgi:hypothetical protein
MQNFIGTTVKTKMIDKNAGTENGLQNLAVYYQSLFDIDENFNHYSWNDFQNAKRKFVKYLMKSRAA